MPTIGFYSHPNIYPRATKFMLENLRKYYPTAPVVISCDNNDIYGELCEKHNVIYHKNNWALGGPTQPYGYNKQKSLEWLDRLHRGVLELHTDFFVMMEDDVIILSKIELHDDWEVVGHVLQYPGQVPPIPLKLMDIIQQYSGVFPKKNYYTTGGGSIFKSLTFLENYDRIRKWFDDNIEEIQRTIYPTLGWIDCYMTVFYLLCGKELTENTRFYNIWPTNIPFDLSTIPTEYDLVHNFKDYY
jgi:hypothetical protein